MMSATNGVDDREQEVDLRVVIPLTCCRSPASSSHAQINILPCRGRLLSSQQLPCCSDAASQCTEEEKDAIEGLAQLRHSEDEHRDSGSIENDYCSLSPCRHRVPHDDDNYYDHHPTEEEDSACSMIMMRAPDAVLQHYPFNSTNDQSAKTTGSCRSLRGILAPQPQGACDYSSLTRVNDDDDRPRPRWRMLADLYPFRPLDKTTHNVDNEKLEKHADIDREEGYSKCIDQTMNVRESERLRPAVDRAGNIAPRVGQHSDLGARGRHTRQYPQHLILSDMVTYHAATPNTLSATSTKKSKWIKRKSLRKVLHATSDYHQT